MVGTEHSPVSCQVFKVVHDDGDEQVDNLDREKGRNIPSLTEQDLIIRKCEDPQTTQCALRLINVSD